jgi:hypothetical protein
MTLDWLPAIERKEGYHHNQVFRIIDEEGIVGNPLVH